MKWTTSYLCASSLLIILKHSHAVSYTKDSSQDTTKDIEMSEGVAAYDSDSIYNQLGSSDGSHFVLQATDIKNPRYMDSKDSINTNAHNYHPTRHDLNPIHDPCTIASKIVGPISYNIVKACLDADFAFPENHRNDTAETIESLISSFYVYEDIAASPPMNGDASGLSFLPTKLISEIDQFTKQVIVNPESRGDDDITPGITHREFHDHLSQILAKARDGHLSYDADCFRAFRFQHGFFMNHVARDGQTVLKVHAVAPYFGSVNDFQDDIFNCDVVTIAGRDASEYIQEFNAALATPQYRSGTTNFFIPGKFSERFMLPEEASLEFSFRCPGRPSQSLLNIHVKWVGFYTHDTTRPYEDTQSYFEANCIKPDDDSSVSQTGINRIELREGNRKKAAELKYTLRDLLGDPGTRSDITTDSVNSSDSASTTSDSQQRPTSKVDDIITKLDLISPQQLPTVKFYDDEGGRLGELSMAANDVSFEEVYRGQHGISSLLLEDGKTGVITVRTESSTIRDQSYSQLHPAWVGSLIQAINILRPVATNLILDLSHNTGGYICLAIAMIQLFFPDRPRLVTNIKLSPLGCHLMSSGAMGVDHFVNSYGESTIPAVYQEDFFSRKIVHPQRNQTFTDYLSDRCAVADHYSLDVDPDEERKRGRNSIPDSRNSSSNETQVYYPWDSENMAILTDGYCGSSCALISNMMHKRFGVRTVVIGGKTSIAEPMSYSTFPGLQVIDDQLIFNEIHNVRLDENNSNEELKIEADADTVGLDAHARTRRRRRDSLRNEVVGESSHHNVNDKEEKAKDEGHSSDDDDEEDDGQDIDQENMTLESIYPREFSHKSRLRLTWRQIYNTGGEFIHTDSKSYQPNWSEKDQWDEYSFIPATMRIEYTDHNVHSMGAIWQDVRDVVWGIEVDL
ncbi:hypothetical protein BGZ76_010717 [Entomortierella beljakovae]|nr:hypothetical protein BGZ76_010717 [Entomortierella beljakovae]